MEKRGVAAFDFDGTITRKDTLLEFIKFVKGKSSCYWGVLLYAPLLVAYKLKLYPNWKVKQRFFAHFFKGMPYTEFCRWGECFAARIDPIVNPSVLEKLVQHQRQGDETYIVSASVKEWILPWAQKVGVSHVIATEVEVDSLGVLTGRFSTKNCYGREKVVRFLAQEPCRESYYLYAYGDSSGDKYMLEFADRGVWCKKM